jgi:hypothetical protein
VSRRTTRLTRGGVSAIRQEEEHQLFDQDRVHVDEACIDSSDENLEACIWVSIIVREDGTPALVRTFVIVREDGTPALVLTELHMV